MQEKIFKGKIIVFTAPSGAGKTTIVREMLKRFDNLAFSVSATTRKPREGEKDGVHYYYLTEEEFATRVDNNEFVEYEEVYAGTNYGTLKSELVRLWNDRKHVLFDIDVKGALAIKKLYGNEALTIFVKPPSLEELENRLTSRATDDSESIKKRVAKFSKEMNFIDRFDIQLVNDQLSVALDEAEQLLKDFINEEE